VSARRWRARAKIAVHDLDHTDIEGAIVTGTWTGKKVVQCTTGATGRCTVSARYGKAKASATFKVTSIQFAGTTYDATANHDPDGDSNGTSIVVAKP
jgi:hypothetical protein